MRLARRALRERERIGVGQGQAPERPEDDVVRDAAQTLVARAAPGERVALEAVARGDAQRDRR